MDPGPVRAFMELSNAADFTSVLKSLAFLANFYKTEKLISAFAKQAVIAVESTEMNALSNFVKGILCFERC